MQNINSVQHDIILDILYVEQTKQCRILHLLQTSAVVLKLQDEKCRWSDISRYLVCIVGNTLVSPAAQHGQYRIIDKLLLSC